MQGWIEFLQGTQTELPARGDAAGAARNRASALRARTSTKASGYGASPVAFESLANLTLGAANLYGSGDVLRSQVRYFDPERRRAGLCAGRRRARRKNRAGSVTLTLVNTSRSAPRRLIVQMGAYGEHQAVSVRLGDRDIPVNAPYFEVRLPLAQGSRLVIATKRLANDPTLRFPWERTQ